MSIIQKAWGWLKTMFTSKKVQELLNIQVITSNEMNNVIDLWDKMYQNNPPWSGIKDCVETKAVNISALIASELARMITIEFKSEITNDKELNDSYQNVVGVIRSKLEYAGAVGGMILKPFMLVNSDKVFVDFVAQGNFYVTKVNALNKITGAIFPDCFKQGEDVFKRLEMHDLDEAAKTYTIRNIFYKNDRQVDKSTIPKWSNLLDEITLSNISEPLFSYYKPALANNIDPLSPLGVSWYSRARDIIEDFEVQYSRLLWEYEATEAAIDVDETLIKTGENGKQSLSKREQRLYRKHNPTGGMQDGKDFFNIFLPSIRDVNVINGLNYMLQMIEDRVGLARGTFSLADTVARTATELKIMRQRTASTISDNQKALQIALYDLATAMQRLKYLGKYERPELEITFEWDDSVVFDQDAKFKELTALVEQGMDLRVLIEWYFGLVPTDRKTADDFINITDLSNRL